MNTKIITGSSRALRLASGDTAPVPFYHAWHANVPVRLSPRTRAFVAALLLLMACLVLWAVTVPLGGAFTGAARVVAVGQNQVVDHLEGGIVQKVFVKQGDAVKAGQLLAQMDVTDASANLTAAQRQRDIDRIRLVRLRAEQDNKDHITWPDDLASQIKQNVELAKAAATQLAEFDSTREKLRASTNILQSQIDTNTQMVTSLKELLAQRRQRLADSEAAVENYQQLFDKGLVTMTANNTAKRQLASDQDQIRQTLLDIDDRSSRASQAEEQLQSVLSQRQSQVADTILQLQGDIFALSEKVRQYQAVVARSDIRSPVDGVIVDISVNTKDQVLGSGKPLFQILPDEVPLGVEAKVDPRYIDSVAMGQSVLIRFNAHERTKQRVMVDGKVNYIAADSTQDTRTGQYSYIVRVSLDPESAKKYGRIIPGSEATVYFELSKQTFAQELLDPYWNMGQHALVE